MPLYDYRCETCGSTFEARHGFHESAPPCPQCDSAEVKRIITNAPATLQGMSANAGRGGTATREQLQNKWAEETPKLREKLVSKLGEETVNRNLPNLNHNYD